MHANSTKPDVHRIEKYVNQRRMRNTAVVRNLCGSSNRIKRDIEVMHMQNAPKSSSLVCICAVGTLTVLRKATYIMTGYQHSCAILEGGYVKCWGRNSHPGLMRQVHPDSSMRSSRSQHRGMDKQGRAAAKSAMVQTRWATIFPSSTLTVAWRLKWLVGWTARASA